MIRTLIVDDDALVRSGLRLMLGGAHDIEVVGEVADGTLVAGAVTELSPDVVLMDIRMPVMDGIAATRALSASPCGPQVIVLTTFGGDDMILAALRAGASGYLLKHTPPEEIVDAVRRAADGEPVLSPAVMQVLIDQATNVAPTGTRHAVSEPDAGPAVSERALAAHTQLAVLSARERDVANAVARGMTNTEIAQTLFLSMGTVKSHISSALTKLDFSNRIQLALLAYEAER
ncbi:two component transcriptional regulator, LuxR family [Sanguibacter gelidistatuariae]|uniref:Two component transcriptional regulator, LuxR family n=1 Tax=Sanguibacter gelidistatuariae TaxID=1814289 RepID=A0A1G6L9S5_9MICO|nr:response regulator transcription factor [Sanguibacter gelidistatuariae]SDC39908.1 two component transcriptional regulator, LuxR family [Sanguibacter gelidistatuariae]